MNSERFSGRLRGDRSLPSRSSRESRANSSTAGRQNSYSSSLSSFDTDMGFSSDWMASHETVDGLTGMDREELEEMDRLVAQRLQLREMRAQDLDMMDEDGLQPHLQFHDFFDLLDLTDTDDSVEAADIYETPTYPVGHRSEVECAICNEMVLLWLRPCCDLPVCEKCLTQYTEIQVDQANVRIECPSGTCSSYIPRDEILSVLDSAHKEKYYRFLIEANQEPHIKSCPRCNFILTLPKEDVKSFRSLPRGFKVECSSCSLIWCFPCQAPWHENVLCKDYRKGDKLLKNWAKKYRGGQQNAQRCPKCKVYIQRAAGCDHMICSRCKTNFCYRCGEQFRHIKFIGDHYSRLSVFGCKYRFLPDKPVKRKFIRGAILGGKLLVAPVVAGLAVGGAVLVLGFGTLAAPFYGGYKLHKRLKERKKRRQRHIQETPYGQMQGNTLFFSEFYGNSGMQVLQNRDEFRFILMESLRRESRRNGVDDNGNVTQNLNDSQSAMTSSHDDSDEVFMTMMGGNNTDATRVTVHRQSDRSCNITSEVSRKYSTEDNPAENEYPMEILNVRTFYDHASESCSASNPEVGEGNSNASNRTPRNLKNRKPLRMLLSERNMGSLSRRTSSIGRSSGVDISLNKDSVASANEKSSCRPDIRSYFAKDLDKSCPDEDTQYKALSKDSERKCSSHMPWLNIVCGKLNKDDDNDVETDKEAMSCPDSSCNKPGKDLNLSADCAHLALSDYYPKGKGQMTRVLRTSEEAPLIKDRPKFDDLGAFGPYTDDDDDWSGGSANQSPLSETNPGHYDPDEPYLDFIDDEDYVSEFSEMTWL